MAEARAEFVTLDTVVISELDHGLLGLRAEPDERQRELAVRVILAAHQPHAQTPGVKTDRAPETPDPDHGMQYAHVAISIKLPLAQG